jgi:hypothetical protein
VNWFTFAHPLPAQGTGSRGDQAMPRIPEWLTVDLMIIAVAMVFIVMIAP